MKYQNIIDSIVAVIGFTVSMGALIWLIAFMAMLGGLL